MMMVLPDHIAVHVVCVVVVMGVDGDLLGGLTPEELQIGRVVAYHFGPTSAADMTVQAEHRVGGGHHHVQVVRDHQHRAAVSCAYLADQRIELGLPGDVRVDKGVPFNQLPRDGQSAPRRSA